MTKMILMIREDEWGLIVLSRVMMVEDGGSSRGWRDAFFYFRDEIEVSFPSVSFLETRTRIFSLNLMVRDEIENSCHLISKFETRSRSFNSLLSNLSQGIVLGWEQSLQKMKVVWWCGKLCCWICEWTTNMPCGGGRNNIDAWKNMNIKIEIFIISLFETKSRFVSSISRALKRDQEFVLSNLEFWEGDMKKKGISCGRARILVAKSHEIFRDREISSCSDVSELHICHVEVEETIYMLKKKYE